MARCIMHHANVWRLRFSGNARIWRWGHKGSGERKSLSGVQRQSPWWVVWGGIASRKLIAVIKDIWKPKHAQFCVFSSTAQPGIFLWTQFRGRGESFAPSPWLRQCSKRAGRRCCCRSTGQTDGRTDTRPFYDACCIKHGKKDLWNCYKCCSFVDCS